MPEKYDSLKTKNCQDLLAICYSIVMKPSLELEPPPVDQEESGAESPAPEPEANVEQEPLRESIDTVDQLLDAWKAEYDQSEDGDRKHELAYRLVKMGEALSASGLRANEVTIRESEPGVLGFFVPATGEIAMTPAGLNLPAEHFKDVLVHEVTHKKGISDEGLTQIITRQEVSGAMHGIYESEQKQVNETFNKLDIASVIDAYDFDHPKELLELYLEVEWQDEWKNTLATDLADDPRRLTDSGRKKIIEGQLKDWTAMLDENLEKAVPRLFAESKAKGFDLSEAHKKYFAKIVEESQEQNAVEVN